jgi:hypothetical protein
VPRKVGDQVSAGQQLGTIGKGHLHQEVIKADYYRQAQRGRGGFVSTSYYGRGPSPTYDPEEYFKLKRPTAVRGGAELPGSNGVDRAAQNTALKVKASAAASKKKTATVDVDFQNGNGAAKKEQSNVGLKKVDLTGTPQMNQSTRSNDNYAEE